MQLYYAYLFCAFNIFNLIYTGSTGDLHIGEAIMNDHFYGIGMSLRDKSATDRTKWKQNKLGILLMTERSLLKNTVVQ